MAVRNQFIPEMFAAQSGNRVMGWNAGTPTAFVLGTGFSIVGNTLNATAAGSVTSVGMSGGSTGLTVNSNTTNPITSTGTFTIGGILNAASGGTGLSSYTVGDLLQANAVNTLQRLQAVATGNVLLSGGVGALSAWGKVGLTTHVSGILPVANGGTGLSGSFNVGDLLYASGPFALSMRPIGSNGQVLTVVSGQPAWAAGGGTGTVTSVDVSGLGTGMTFLGGPITSSGSITMTGVLDADNGGTGQSSYTIGDILQASSATAISKLAAVATGNVLLSGGVAALSSWGKVGLTTHVIGTLPAANGGTNLTSYTTGDILYASGTNTLARLAAATNGYVLTLVAGLPAWAAPTGGGGGGSVTSVGLAAPSIFSVTGSPVTASGTLTLTLNTQSSNLVWAGPASGAAAAPSFRNLVIADLPNWVIEDIPIGSNYTFQTSDNNKIKRFVDTTPRNNTIPTGLPTGWNCIIVRGPSAATPTILSLGTYEGAGNTLDSPNTWAQLVHRGSNVHMASGAFTGLTNTAANTELAMSDGNNLVPSGVYAPTANNLRLGTSSTAGNRVITFDSSDSTPTLSIQNQVSSPSAGMVLGKGLSTLKLYSSVQVFTSSSLVTAIATIAQINSLGVAVNALCTDNFTNFAVNVNGVGALVRLAGGNVTTTSGNSSTTGSVSISPGVNANATSPGTGISSGNILMEMPAPFGAGVFGNMAIFNPTYGIAPNFQSGQKIVFIGNSAAIPSGNPVGGGYLYVEAGALKWRGSSGTVTTLGAA